MLSVNGFRAALRYLTMFKEGMICTVSLSFLTVVFGFLLAKQFGYGVVGVWMAMQIDWVFRIICFVWRFKSGAWEKKQLI